MRRRRPGDGFVFLSPLTLSNDSPGRHGRRWAWSCRRHARCRQLSLNYELNLWLQSRFGDDVVNLPEAFALKGPSIPCDHLVTWNSRKGSSFDSFLWTVVGMETVCSRLLRVLSINRALSKHQSWKYGLQNLLINAKLIINFRLWFFWSSAIKILQFIVSIFRNKVYHHVLL